MAWYSSIGKKISQARTIGKKVAHTVSVIGRKGGNILNKVADAAGAVPGIAGISPVLHQAANIASGVGNVAHSVESAISSTDIKSAVAAGGMAYAHGKALKRSLEKKSPSNI